MSNTNAQAVGFVGSSIASLLKLGEHIDNLPHAVRITMEQLNGQVGSPNSISGGQTISLAETNSRPTVGAAQNSGLERH